MVEDLGLVLFISIVVMLFMVAILIKLENKSVIRILKRLGIDVYIKDIWKYYRILNSLNNDVVGFVNIEGVCQCPVMLGDYSKKDINKRYSSVGELYILDNALAKSFKSVSNGKTEEGDFLGDMTVISGSIRNKNCTSMGAKFSLLRQYVHTLKTNNPTTIQIFDGAKTRKYKILFGVDLKIEDLRSFTCKDRYDLIDKLVGKSYYSYNYKYNNKICLDNNIIVFISPMDIDTHLVMAVEV